METRPGLFEALNESVPSSIRGDPGAACWISRTTPSGAGGAGFVDGQKLVARFCAASASASRPTAARAKAPTTPTATPVSARRCRRGRSRPPVNPPSRSTPRRKSSSAFQESRRQLRPGRPSRFGARLRLPELGEAVHTASTTSPTISGGSIRHRPRPRRSLVESVRRWWYGSVPPAIPPRHTLLPRMQRQRRRASAPVEAGTAGSGGRTPDFDHRLSICHRYQRWNRIEHRLSAFILRSWHGRPFVSRRVIIELPTRPPILASPSRAGSTTPPTRRASRSLTPKWLASTSRPANFHQ